MNKHTPGPWRYDAIQEGTVNIASGKQSPMRDAGFAITAIEPRMFGGTRLVEKGIRSEADAKLIAAAPDMAEALRAMCATMRTFRDVPKDEQEWTSTDDDALNSGFAALAKAGL